MGFNKAHKMAQRLHRERRQPEHRKKFGYLEKKKDYKKRALDFQTKAEQLKKLKNKVLERNPNEFHLHMVNSRIVDGVHQDVVRPMDPKIKRRLVKKDELVERYNEQVLKQRLCKANPKKLPIEHEPEKKTKRKHLIFNK